jgi:Tol biopolymer transport system component
MGKITRGLLVLIGLTLLAACTFSPTNVPSTPVPAVTELPPTATATRPTAASAGEEEAVRSILTSDALTNGFEAVSPVDESALTAPANANPAAHVFEGRLELLGEKDGGQIQLLRGELGPEYGYLPEFDFEFVQSEGILIPVQRGLMITDHPQWNIILEPGRAWQEAGDGGFSRASIPFALTVKGGNATFNGTLTFLFDDKRVSKVWYQITQETTSYTRANLWGLLDAAYHPAPVAGAERIRADFAAELAARLPVKPIQALAEDYPGVDVSAFGRGVTPEHMTWYGVVANGVNYVGGCQTRFGVYPYCESMRATSYSTAKSAFVSVALMRLAQKYGPEVADLLIKDYVPEYAASSGDWERVTFNDTIDMSTGNYSSAGYMTDEDGDKMGEFFGAQPYAERIAAAFGWPHAAEPGTHWVYHTSDTFILTRALHNYLRTRDGPDADIFQFVVDEVYRPLELGPGAYTTMRTADDEWQGQAEGGYGLWWIPDDIAKIATLLNNDGGVIGGVQVLHPGLLAAALQHDPGDRGVQIDSWRMYNNAFWADRYTTGNGFDCQVWVPQMLGVSGNVVALMPNGVTYYYFSDNQEFTWEAAVREADKIIPLCRTTPGPTPVPATPTPAQILPTHTPPPPGGVPQIAFVSTRDGNGEIYVMDADGSNPRRLTDHRLWDGFPGWSPDGSQIAYYSYVNNKNWAIKVMNADGSNPRQLTDNGVCDGAPQWSPDGTRIAYSSDADCTAEHREIYVIDIDGNNPRNLTQNEADEMSFAWSPDGQQLVFSSNRDGNYELYTMAADGGKVRRLTENGAQEMMPAWSPDGGQIAFVSDRDGNDEIYMMDVSGDNVRRLTDNPANDWFPGWSPDGTQIVFNSWRDGNLEIYVMDADGSNIVRLTNNPAEDFNAVWQPKPADEAGDTWSRSYQGEILGTVLDGTLSGDGGYLFVGSTHYTHNNRDDEDLYLLKTNAAGGPQWEKTLGGDRFDRGVSILSAAGGGFLVLGETRSFGAGDRDMYLLMIDDQGQQLWARTFGGPKEEQAFAIQPTSDGGYVLSAQTASFGAGGTDVYLVKTDAQGNEEWSQTYGSELDEEGCCAAELPEGGFLVVGVRLHQGGDYLAMDPDLYLVRTDEQGNVRWSQVLEKPGAQAAFGMLPTPDGHYVISGLRSDTTSDVGIDPLLIQIDADGSVLWDRAVGEADILDYGSALLQTADGGYLLAGMSVRSGRGGIPLTRLDGNGQVLWRRMLSEERGNRAGIAILPAADGGYLVVGTVSDGGQGWYTLLIKTDDEGN